MNAIKTISKELEKFGLSENQAGIYVALVQSGELRIQEIANLLNIPRTSVYEHLKVLVQMGLVEKIIDHKFVRIRPYPIGTMKLHLNEKIEELQKKSKELEKIERNLFVLSNPKSLASTTVRYYKDVSGARQLFWNTLKAKNIVYVYSEYGRPKYVGKKFYSEFVRESLERKIKEQVLINPTERVLNLLKVYLGSALARTTAKDMRTIDPEKVLIKGETFIYDNIYAQVYIYTGEINGFEIENDQFALTQRSIFETLWDNAPSLTKLLKEKNY